MKKLHLVTSKDSLRPQLQHIQVKDGFVYASDCHVLVKIPVNEVFADTIAENEELYFLGEQWKSQNISKAVYLKREGLIFKAFDKKMNLIGMIEAIEANVFTKNVGQFPECNRVIPQGELEQINMLAINYKLYSNLVECFNDEATYRMEFRGNGRGVIIRNYNTKSEAIGLIMPIFLSEWR
jgi:hypothetical protein